MEAAKASFVETRHAREEREMRTSMEAIQAGDEDAQRRAMAQRDAEMARARTRYATSSQQGSAEYQIYTANMAKVTAPKALLPANRIRCRPDASTWATKSRPQRAHHGGLDCYDAAR